MASEHIEVGNVCIGCDEPRPCRAKLLGDNARLTAERDAAVLRAEAAERGREVLRKVVEDELQHKISMLTLLSIEMTPSELDDSINNAPIVRLLRKALSAAASSTQEERGDGE